MSKEILLPLLAKVYGWFTEGFDTAVRQEDRALLDEWRNIRCGERGRAESKGG